MRAINIASYVLNILLFIALSNARTTINRYERVVKMLGIK